MLKINLSDWNVEDEGFWKSTGKKNSNKKLMDFYHGFAFGLCRLDHVEHHSY